jgi:hypothetical protein
VAGSSDRDNNQFFLTVITLAKLHIKSYRRAETELQEGQYESCLTIEGLPPGYHSCDVGLLLNQIDNTMNTLTVANITVTRDLLHDGSGDMSSFTAVVDNILVTKQVLDFIEQRIEGPSAAQTIFFRQGSPEISLWSSLSFVRTPKIQSILKMLRLSGFSKSQAEHSILNSLQFSISATCPDVSALIKAVRISDIRLVT